MCVWMEWVCAWVVVWQGSGRVEGGEERCGVTMPTTAKGRRQKGDGERRKGSEGGEGGREGGLGCGGGREGGRERGERERERR